MELEPQQDLLNTEELLIANFGTFWPRFWALLIDGLILAILTPLTVLNKTEWKSVILLIIISLIQLSYKSFFEFTYSATPGKMTLELKVVNNDFGKASLDAILRRNIFQISGGLIALALAIYSYVQPNFIYATTLNAYNQLSTIRTVTLILNFVLLTVYIIDLIVMLNSDESRSLHDRIGGTYVIRT